MVFELRLTFSDHNVHVSDDWFFLNWSNLLKSNQTKPNQIKPNRTIISDLLSKPRF